MSAKHSFPGSLPLATLVLLTAFHPHRLSAQTPPAKTTRTCLVDKSLPTDGERALAREDYDTALTFYRSAVDRPTATPEDHLGLVRALIGKDKTADATKEAQAAVSLFPQSSIPKVAAAEAAYRAADFTAARNLLHEIITMNPCEAQGIALLARLDGLFALYASESRFITMAHKLRPNDQGIRQEWIYTLPAKERTLELQKFLDDKPDLSADDLTGVTNSLDHLKAHHAGECHITSKSETVKVPFQLVFGDSSHAQAFGLDLSFNGTRRRLQIDTGASGIVLSQSAAKRLNLTPEYHLHASGIGDEGNVDSYLTHVAKIQIGDVELSDCMVEVLGKDKGHFDVDGIIGMDVFSRWVATLDYPASQLRLSPLPPRPKTTEPSSAPTSPDPNAEEDDTGRHDAYVAPEMADWLRVARVGHNILLPAILNHHSGPLHYVIADTGAAETIISLAFAREVGKPWADSDSHFYGISGQVKKVYRLETATLQFAYLALPPETYYSFDMTSTSHDLGIEASGFIGLPTLSRLVISIDYRDNLINLKYDPKNDFKRF